MATVAAAVSQCLNPQWEEGRGLLWYSVGELALIFMFFVWNMLIFCKQLCCNNSICIHIYVCSCLNYFMSYCRYYSPEEAVCNRKTGREIKLYTNLT